jgi:hypothetical protein
MALNSPHKIEAPLADVLNASDPIMRKHLAIVNRDDLAALQSALDADLAVDARFRFRAVSSDSMVSQGA